MKTTLTSKSQKSLKKLPPHIQKKFRNLLTDLTNTNSLHNLYQKWHMEKMMYDSSIFRAKLDYSYRVGLFFDAKSNQVEIVQVSSRENFNYVGGC